MRVLVLGAGGLGGYFGGRLAQAGRDVTFLVREPRAARLHADGLRIESALGDTVLQVKTCTEARSVGPCDLVLLSCKAYDLDDAIATVRPAVGPGTSVLPLLNGLAHLARLDTAFGADAVLGGLAHISVTLAGDGTVRHFGKLDTLTFGSRHADQGERCARIATLFDGVPFTTRQSDTIVQDMWEKFAFITAAASATCLMRAPVGAILDTVDGQRLIETILAECDGVAAASGHPIRAKAARWSRDLLTQRGSAFTTSMLRDLQAGARIEADHLQGDMIARADTLGVSADMLRVAFCHLQAYETCRRG